MHIKSPHRQNKTDFSLSFSLSNYLFPNLGASMESSLSRRGLEMFLVGAMFSFSSVIVRRKRNTYNDKPMRTYHCYQQEYELFSKSRSKVTNTSSTSAAEPSRYFFMVPPTSGRINLLPSSNMLSHTNTLEEFRVNVLLIHFYPPYLSLIVLGGPASGVV